MSLPEEQKRPPEAAEGEGVKYLHSSSLRTETFTYISIVYAQILISICITYLVAEVITHNIPIFYFEEFFTYLYTVSIVFLVYVLIYLKREAPTSLLCGMKLPKFNMNCPWSRCTSKEPESKRKKHKISDNEKSHGSIFIRFGVVIFGLGTVTHAALEFGSLVEATVSSPCHDFMYGFNSLLQIIFTFLQMYFLFTNARINIQKFKHVARFGLMHLAATNLCVWFKILVRESIHDIREYEDDFHKRNWLSNVHKENHSENASYHHEHTHAVTLQDVLNCSEETIMGNIVSVASPYIFPLVIEYSLIAATVVYLMWKHVGVNPVYIEDKNPTTKSRISCKLDFKHSSKGLFGGLLVFLSIIICLILFFVLSDNEDKHYVRLAVYFVDASHCIVLVVCIIISIVGLHQTQKLHYHDEPEDELTELLLRISAFGWYLYSLFTIIACAVTKGIVEHEEHHEEHDHKHTINEEDMPVSEVTIVLIGAVINMIQVTIQLFFMNDVSKKNIEGKELNDSKPGRQAVTFLFMCNFTLWLLYTFEAAKVEANPVQLHFYGSISWAILLRITLPMGIFFRFHSSVTMAEIWKNTYKQRIVG